MYNIELILMLKTYFKIILFCNIPDSVAIVFNKRLLLINIYIYLFFFFIYNIL